MTARRLADNNQKTCHHNHVTGKYLFPACNSCNFELKPRKCKIAMTQSNSTKVVSCNDNDDEDDEDDDDDDNNDDDDDDDDEDDGDSGGDDEWTYLMPIVFHNLSSYDGHFVLQSFARNTPSIRRGLG